MAILTTVIAAATLVFAIYDMFRIVQKISQVPATASADVSVGWGLICVLSAAVLAMLVALARLLHTEIALRGGRRASDRAASAIRSLAVRPYCGGPEESWTVAVWVCPELSVHPIVTLSPGW